MKENMDSCSDIVYVVNNFLCLNRKTWKEAWLDEIEQNYDIKNPFKRTSWLNYVQFILFKYEMCN